MRRLARGWDMMGRLRGVGRRWRVMLWVRFVIVKSCALWSMLYSVGREERVANWRRICGRVTSAKEREVVEFTGITCVASRGTDHDIGSDSHVCDISNPSEVSALHHLISSIVFIMILPFQSHSSPATAQTPSATPASHTSTHQTPPAQASPSHHST